MSYGHPDLQLPVKLKKGKVLCPCCVGDASEARPESWYHERKLVQPIPAPEGCGYTKGARIWQCVICKNKRQVTPAQAMTFILLNL